MTVWRSVTDPKALALLAMLQVAIALNPPVKK